MADVPTIRSLAKTAGVSSATVSLALRNHPRIRPEVRARIQQIATEAGYKPNPIVAHLIAQVRASKTMAYQSTLGMVFTATRCEDFEVPTIQQWVSSCEARAHQLGYGFDRFIPCQSGTTPERLTKILDARGIRGLFTTGPFLGGAIPPRFDVIWRRSATIVLGIRPTRPALSGVMNDQFSTAVQAMKEVARLGYRRPGLCINSDIESFVEYRFLAGFLVGQSRLPREDHVPPFNYDSDAKKAFQQWMKRYRPDVILTLHTQLRDWLESTGLSVPTKIGLVHLDRTAELAGWAGIRQNNEQIGLAAVDMLIGQLHRNELGTPPFQKCMFIEGTWVNGETVRKQGRGTGRKAGGKRTISRG